MAWELSCTGLRSADPLAVLTLRSLYNERRDFLITTFSLADANQAPPGPLIFPQIADAGGYQTQIIPLSAGGVIRSDWVAAKAAVLAPPARPRLAAARRSQRFSWLQPTTPSTDG
jgi:hypothetical protein